MTQSISNLTRWDFREVFECMRLARDEIDTEDMDMGDDYEQICKILSLIVAGAGVGILHRTDGKIDGFFLALVTPCLWNPRRHTLNEILWWVAAPVRKTRRAYKLLNEYFKQAETMIQQGRITHYTITRHNGGAGVDYSRFNMRPIETVWAGS